MDDKPNERVVDMLDVVEVPTTLEERLEIAAMVTRGLEAKITLGNSVIESLKETISDRDKTLLHMARFHQKLASSLLQTYDMAHADKNRVIMRVAADLLRNAESLLYPPPRYDDDVPF